MLGGLFLRYMKLRYGKERHGDPRFRSAQNSVGCRCPANFRDAPATMFPGFNNPNVGNSEGEIIVDPILHRRHGVIGRHDFGT